MNSVALGHCFRIGRFLKPYFVKSNPNQYARDLTCFTKIYAISAANSESNAARVRNFPRTVCSSSVTKSDDKSNEHPTDEHNKNFDEEFQNILKDFAKDFGLNEESGKALEDIKKSLDEPDGNVGASSYKSEEDGTHHFKDGKFRDFSDSDSVVFHSYEEIQSGSCNIEDQTFHIDQTREVDLSKLKVKRGISGVYEINELVDFLRKESLLDIAVISIPKHLHYADFLVLANARSPRHSKAVAEHVTKLYKMKKHSKDAFFRVEGEDVSSWKALDMGNIVLHIFMEETRAFYDIESLWLFDSDFDSGGLMKQDPVFDAIQEQMEFFNAMQESPSTTSGKETT